MGRCIALLAILAAGCSSPTRPPPPTPGAAPPPAGRAVEELRQEGLQIEFLSPLQQMDLDAEIRRAGLRPDAVVSSAFVPNTAERRVLSEIVTRIEVLQAPLALATDMTNEGVFPRAAHAIVGALPTAAGLFGLHALARSNGDAAGATGRIAAAGGLAFLSDLIDRFSLRHAADEARFIVSAGKKLQGLEQVTNDFAAEARRVNQKEQWLSREAFCTDEKELSSRFLVIANTMSDILREVPGSYTRSQRAFSNLAQTIGRLEAQLVGPCFAAERS
jgi:hypothetical protein